MIYLFYGVHVLVCFFLILVVLLQQGKGADLSVFGGGSTQAAFGARGAATLLHKLTVVAFVAFIVTTIGIGFLQSGQSSGSVMTSVEQPATEEPPAEPAADGGALDQALQEAAATADDAATAVDEATTATEGDDSTQEPPPVE